MATNHLDHLRRNIAWFAKNPGYVYLDSAATTLKPDHVLNAIQNYAHHYATNPHNDDSLYAHQTNVVLKICKQKLAKYLNCDPACLVYTAGATYSLNQIAWHLQSNLQAGDEIVLSTAEHSSNLLPWYDLKTKLGVELVFANATIADNDYDLFLNKLTPKTKVVAFANETNLLGTKYDANVLAAKIKAYNPNIFVVVDATQYLAHYAMDLANSPIDFVCGSAHKMLGPTGLGFLYVRKALLPHLIPLWVGGGMNHTIDQKAYTLMDGTDKLEAGTPNVMGIFGFNAALDYYLDPTLPTHQTKVHQLKTFLDWNLAQIPFIKVHNSNLTGFITIFTCVGVHSQDFAHYLGNHKIIVRSGLSCAKLADVVLAENSVVRVSLHFYNNYQDVKQLINVVQSYERGAELDGLV